MSGYDIAICIPQGKTRIRVEDAEDLELVRKLLQGGSRQMLTDDGRTVSERIDDIDPLLAFKELAEAAGDRWDEIDAEEYVRDLRTENDSD